MPIVLGQPFPHDPQFTHQILLVRVLASRSELRAFVLHVQVVRRRRAGRLVRLRFRRLFGSEAQRGEKAGLGPRACCIDYRFWTGPARRLAPHAAGEGEVQKARLRHHLQGLCRAALLRGCCVQGDVKGRGCGSGARPFSSCRHRPMRLSSCRWRGSPGRK